MWSEVCDTFADKDEDVKYIITIKKELKDILKDRQIFSVIDISDYITLERA